MNNQLIFLKSPAVPNPLKSSQILFNKLSEVLIIGVGIAALSKSQNVDVTLP